MSDADVRTVCGELYPVEQRNVVKQVRVGKGHHTEDLAEPRTLALGESIKRQY